jgi:hypothetical protein
MKSSHPLDGTKLREQLFQSAYQFERDTRNEQRRLVTSLFFSIWLMRFQIQVPGATAAWQKHPQSLIFDRFHERVFTLCSPCTHVHAKAGREQASGKAIDHAQRRSPIAS